MKVICSNLQNIDVCPTTTLTQPMAWSVWSTNGRWGEYSRFKRPA